MAARGIQEYFTADEAARLEEGLPRPERWSAHVLVPFQGYRVPSARIAWVNRRWFQERLFDLQDRYVLSRVCAWLLDDFAYIAVPDENFTVSCVTTRRHSGQIVTVVRRG